MAIILFSDNASTTLAQPITSTATTLTVATGSGAKFPVPGAGQYFLLTLVDAATGTVTEIVQVTTVSTDTFTIVRGQEGTAAVAWLAGDAIANMWTSGSAAAMVQVSQLQQQAGNYAADTGTANNYAVTLAPIPSSLAFLTGVPIRVLLTNTNTGVSTIDVNGLGATTIVHPDGSAMAAGELMAGAIATIIYNGTSFQLNDLVFQLLSRNNTWTGVNAFPTQSPGDASTKAATDAFVAAAVAVEAAARTAADTALQTNITTEATTRAAADTTLQTNINTEATTRQTSISNEAATRAAADTTLQTNINNEATTRAAVDATKVPLSHMGYCGGSTVNGAGNLNTSASFTPVCNGIVHISGFGGANTSTPSAVLTVYGGTVLSGGSVNVSTGTNGPGLVGYNAVALVTANVPVTIAIGLEAETSTSGGISFVYVLLPTS